MKALNHLIFAKEETLANLESFRETLCDSSVLKDEREEVAKETAAAEKEIRSLITKNASARQDQGKYRKKYDGLHARYEQASEKLENIEDEIKKRRGREVRIKDFIGKLKGLNEEQAKFDENLWCGMVECVTVYSKEQIVFTFIGGIEVTVN